MPEVISTLVWAAVVLAIFGAIIWRVDRAVRDRTKLSERSQELTDREASVALRERELAADLKAGTLAADTDRRNAELELQAARDRLATEVVADTKGDVLTAERRAIEARALAEEELAPEFVRAAHEGAGEPDYVAMWTAHVEAARRNNVVCENFDDFVEVIRGS